MSGGLLTRVDLATRVGYSPHTLRKWQHEGLPVAVRGVPGSKGKPSLYDEADVRAWLKAREVQRLGLTQARARREHWQALLSEQAHKARSLELLPRADVERERARLEADVRAKLGAMPAAYSPRLASAIESGGQPGLERALDEAVRKVLLELAGKAAGEPRKERT